MSELEEMLRDTARQLLADKKVEMIIGFERGTLPLRTRPCFVRDAADAERLVWNLYCGNNLATYLHSVTGKVGIVAKGCDTRAIVTKVTERQIPRENVVIIGVPCQGVIDRRAIEEQLDGREVQQVRIADGSITLGGVGYEETLPLREVLSDQCVTCRHKNPPLCDVFVGQAGEDSASPGADGDGHLTVQELESWTADERWAYFSSEFSRCIRCYACREACPCCYCSECFVDQTQPSWFGKSDDLSDVMAFHLVRILHVAGRCVQCGACARACPMHIDLRTLGQKLEKDMRAWFQYEPGMDLASRPLLGTFQPDDPQDFS